MTGSQLKGTIKYLKLAKEHGKRTILGGIHVTMQPEQCLQEDYVDSIVLSEGEWAIIEAIHGGHKHVAHGHLHGDHVSPVSPETLIHFQRSSRTGDTVLLTSRGCPLRCGFCLDGDTPVMMSDLTWKAIRDIVPGDEIVGLQKVSYGHETARSKVLATSKRKEKTYKIVTTQGDVIATGDHQWLSHSDHSRWRKTKNLHVGDSIRFLTGYTKTREETHDYKVGYIAGIHEWRELEPDVSSAEYQYSRCTCGLLRVSIPSDDATESATRKYTIIIKTNRSKGHSK